MDTPIVATAIHSCDNIDTLRAALLAAVTTDAQEITQTVLGVLGDGRYDDLAERIVARIDDRWHYKATGHISNYLEEIREIVEGELRYVPQAVE